MRTWTHGSLIDSITSVPLKELVRKFQRRVNKDLEQSGLVLKWGIAASLRPI